MGGMSIAQAPFDVGESKYPLQPSRSTKMLGSGGNAAFHPTQERH